MTERWDAVASLVDPSRRALYDHVRRQDHPVGREEAAQATGMSRGLAAFHLDKLVDAGLLRARYETPGDRPRGRGRTPKVYEPDGDGLAVTLPERRYELIADILAEAVAGGHLPVAEAAARVAHRHGRALGAAVRATGAGVVDALTGLGFEPRDTGWSVLLHNCPFQALATRHTALVCGLNHSFVAGIVDAWGGDVDTRLVARPGMCCVELVTAPPAGSPTVDP